jgi:hypothetical protein
MLPGNSSVNTVEHATIDEAMFSMSSAPSSGGTTGLRNPFLNNDSANKLPHRQCRHTRVNRDHVTCFL